MPETKPIRILHMEDNAGIARLVEKRLTRAGYVVDLACNGQEGLAMFNTGRYDLLVVDQNMPVYNGLGVIRSLVSQGPLPPMIMVTGTGNQRVAVQAMKLGADDYVVKDMDGGYLDLLPTIVERVLKQRRLLDEKRRAEEEIARIAKFPSEDPNPVLRVSRDGHLLYSNKASAALLNTWQWLEGHPLSKRWVRLVREALRSRQGLQTEVECPDRVLSLTFAPVVESDYVNVYGHDVTNRKRAEEALRESEQRFRCIFDHAIDGIYIVDMEDKRTHMANKTFCRMLGYGLEELRGLGVADIHAKEDLAYAMKQFKRLARREITLANDIRVKRKDGSIFWADIAGAPVSLVGRRYLMCIFRDITERKGLERRLAQSQKLEAIGQLAAGIAHDINTPIQYIGGNVQFLEESFSALSRLIEKHRSLLDAVKAGPVPKDVVATVEAAASEADTEYLFREIPTAIREAIEGVDRVAGIVRAMKEFSHPGNETKTAVDLNQAIESTITVARSEWKYVAEMATNFDPDLPLVPCLPGDFNMAILNMVVNAAQAIAERVGDGSNGKGTITVRTRAVNDWAEIRISDTGTGIPEEARPRIFDPFFTTKTVGNGTGQGLTMVHDVVVQKHGGMITFNTEVGKGTTFIIRMPLAPVHAAEKELVG